LKRCGSGGTQTDPTSGKLAGFFCANFFAPFAMPSFSATTGGTRADSADDAQESARSVGAVVAQSAHFDAPLKLACGKTLPDYELAFEMSGTLNADRSIAVLIWHAFRASPTVAGYYADDRENVGSWDNMIGPW